MGKTLIVAGVIALTALFIAAQKAFPCDGEGCRPCAPEYVTQINQQTYIAEKDSPNVKGGFYLDIEKDVTKHVTAGVHSEYLPQQDCVQKHGEGKVLLGATIKL